MTLDKIKTQTTWNDASASINSNFAKILQALGGGIPEGVDSTLIRTLYFNDDSENNPLTDEQLAYNAETYSIFMSGDETPLIVMADTGMTGIYDEMVETDDAILIEFNAHFDNVIVRDRMALYPDGTTVSLEGNYGIAFSPCDLNVQLGAILWWEYREIIPEAIGGFQIDGVFYQIDSWSIENDVPMVEYNVGSKRYRAIFDEHYAIKETIDITPSGGGGGGSIDPELLEGYLPMMREFSDDFNNDFTR